MERYICIHGHFYQPPRENAWLEFVELQDSAYPFHDWNQRVTAECYGPNGMSRILDPDGDIERITNNYARISFNFGPTLLAWLAENEHDVYNAILNADRESQTRFSGHGSALAQSYNHSILPLSNCRDKYTQVLWGIRDFEFRFGRRPEGMWLPETAVDLETLDILAELGIQFTILSPYQARAVRRLRGRVWRDVNGGQIDPSEPYKVRLPSGRQIAVFFYDGPVSRAIAFERLLERGENLADRLLSAFSDDRPWPQLVHIATDGETYGHHHKKGEMALAYALQHIEKNQLAQLTNYGEYLERRPPFMEAEIWERSAWSCSHGVERWNSNCGCNSGGYPGWNQEWRKPLREALDWLRDAITPRFEQKGAGLLRDAWSARNDYIRVILSRTADRREEFFRQHAARTLNDAEKTDVLKLMEMQRHAMLMYTSCGWFFDELSGIETTQVIHYAGRTLQLFDEVFGESLEAEFLSRLERARSNIPEHQNGRVIYEKFVKPSMVDRKKVAAHYALSSLFKPYTETDRVYCYTVEQEDVQARETGRARLIVGAASVTSEITLETDTFSFAGVYIGDNSMTAGVAPYRDDESYGRLKEDIVEPFTRADFPGIVRIFDQYFGDHTYSLRSIFHDDQRKIVDVILRSTLTEAEAVYRQLYETHAPMMRFLADLRIPPPRFLQAAGEFALNSALREAFENLDSFDPVRLRAILDEAQNMNVRLDSATLAFTLTGTIQRLSQRLLEDHENVGVIQRMEQAASLAQELPFEVNVWKAQNNYYELLQRVFPEFSERATQDDPAAREWLSHFVALGRNLHVRVEEPVLEEVLETVS
jgi:alpha-amylase/alpha-mannosidase (GH57 family)